MAHLVAGEPADRRRPWSALRAGLLRCTLYRSIAPGAGPAARRALRRPAAVRTPTALPSPCASLRAEFRRRATRRASRRRSRRSRSCGSTSCGRRRACVAVPGAYVDVTATVSNDGTAEAGEPRFSLRPVSGALLNARITGAANGWSCASGGGVGGHAGHLRARSRRSSPRADTPPVTLRFDVSPSQRYGACLGSLAAPRCLRVTSAVWMRTEPSVHRRPDRGDRDRRRPRAVDRRRRRRPDDHPGRARALRRGGHQRRQRGGSRPDPRRLLHLSPQPRSLPAGRRLVHRPGRRRLELRVPTADDVLAPGPAGAGRDAARLVRMGHAGERRPGRGRPLRRWTRLRLPPRGVSARRTGDGDGPTDTATSPLVPVRSGLALPGGLTARIAGPPGKRAAGRCVRGSRPRRRRPA